MALLAAIALGLTAIGIYGLGRTLLRHPADPRDWNSRWPWVPALQRSLRMIIRQGMTLAAIGLGAGAAGSLLVTRYLSKLLFGVTPTER